MCFYESIKIFSLTWLINIANKHLDAKNYMEAAQSYLHCSALVAEYLTLKNETMDQNLPNSIDEFAELSDNIYEESAVSEDIIK